MTRDWVRVPLTFEILSSGGSRSNELRAVVSLRVFGLAYYWPQIIIDQVGEGGGDELQFMPGFSILSRKPSEEREG